MIKMTAMGSVKKNMNMTDRQKTINPINQSSKGFLSSLFLTILFQLVLVIIGYGQQMNFEESLQLQLDNEGKKNVVFSVNEVRLLQLGQHNEANTIQKYNGGKYSPNVIASIQSGSYNEVYISQEGNGNISSAVQIGSFNIYNLDLEGDENISAIIQTGNRNNIEQELHGNAMEYVITQQGNHNNIQQIEKNSRIPQYEIHQKGIGISVRIESLSIY